MRVPVSLLRRLVAVDVPLDTLVRELNARVSEIEHLHRFPAREAFAGVQVVRLEEAVARQDGHARWRLHDGRHLVVGDRFEVVAGGCYAAVLAGSALPDGTTIDARPVAGMESDGALVSEGMLGIGKETARPLRFAPEVPPGADAWSTLDLDDVVLEFDLEPNRPDLFSLAGVARDVGAIWGGTVTLPAQADLTKLPALTTTALRLDTPRARAYLAVELEGITVGPSPQWLQNAVRKLGMRPINNVVDAANLAMLELGEPMHTFDADRLRGDAIVLRMADDGETVTTLDGVERTLTQECLLVCDGAAAGGPSRPIAIAGIMGDSASEVHAGTRRVIVEVAAFDMAAIRRASRRLSLRTEASLRFEKGLPVASLEPAAGRLVQLLQEVAGARPVAIARAGVAAPARVALPLDRENLRGRLGMDIDDGGIDRILRASGCEVTGDTCLAPEFRPDLAIPEDLVEEIGRLHGYEHVQSVAPSMALVAPRANPWVTTARRTRRLLTAHGYDEVYLPVWIGDGEIAQYGLDAGSMVKLINPLAENLCWFRPTSLPHLVEAAVQNRKELERFAFFEVGKTYARASDGTLVERQHLGALSLGQGDVPAARDLLVALARASGADATVTRTTHPHLHPGRTASVGGWATVGELHPRLVREHGLREAPVVILADLETLAGLQPALVKFVAPPRFPGMTLDLNVTVPARTEVASVLAAVPGTPDLRQAEVVDVWPLAEGARLTLRFAFNAGDRSLVQDEVTRQMATVRTALEGAGWGVA